MSVHLANQSSELLTSSNCFTAIYRQIIGFRAGTTQVDDFPFNKQTKLQVEKKKTVKLCMLSFILAIHRTQKDPLNWLGSREQIVVCPFGSTAEEKLKTATQMLLLLVLVVQCNKKRFSLLFSRNHGKSQVQNASFIRPMVAPRAWNWKKSIVVIVPLKNDRRENNRNDRRIPGPSATPGAEDN